MNSSKRNKKGRGKNLSDVNSPVFEGIDADRTKRRRRPVPPKMYRIGEIVEYSGVSRQTIHNYTTMGLLRESGWTQGGHRLYDENVFDRLDRIAEMKCKKRSMESIRNFFTRLDMDDPEGREAFATQ